MIPLLRNDMTKQDPATVAHRVALSTTRSASPTDEQPVGEASKISQAAKDFEAVFLRQMLSALEKTTKVGDKSPTIPGQQTYGSMIVEAVADAVSAAGGLGLGKILSNAMAEKAGVPAQDPSGAALTNPAVKADLAQATSRSADHPASALSFRNKLPQGLTSNAVPIAETRKATAQTTEQVADQRIR